MTVEELLAILELLPGNLPVLMSKDPEGNRFYYLSEAAVSNYVDEDEELQPLHPYDEPEYPERKPCVVLWP